MNILLIHQYFLEDNDHGGSRFNEMAANWIRSGNQVTVIAGMVHYNGNKKKKEYKGKFYKRTKQGKINVIRTHVSETYNSSFLGRLWGYFSFMFSSLFAGLFLTREKYDFILVTSPPLFIGFSGYVISRIKRIPFVFEVRDLWPESAIDTNVLKSKLLIDLAYSLENFIYRKAHLINVLTPAFRKNLIETKGVDPSKIIFIPNGADFRISESLLKNFDHRSFRKKLGWEDKFIVVYVGAHGVANHLEQVFDASLLLKDTNVLFVMIGSGMRKPFLLDEKKRLNIENVVFLDPVPKKEIFQYILASDMGASILKKVDAFKTIYSNKTFDYMSCKKPVLMAIDGVSRDLVHDSNGGSYVEPENPLHYKEIITSYLADPEKKVREGQNGYEYVKENFDREILSSKYLQLITEKVLN